MQARTAAMAGDLLPVFHCARRHARALFVLAAGGVACLAFVSATTAQETAPDHTQTDLVWMRRAEQACRNDDFVDFFGAFARSEAVRVRFTAERLRASGGAAGAHGIIRRGRFPVGLEDNTYLYTGPGRVTGRVPDYLQMRFTRRADGGHQVDWRRIRFDGNGNDRDGQARIVGTRGRPGQLIFSRTTDCWRLDASIMGRAPPTEEIAYG